MSVVISESHHPKECAPLRSPTHSEFNAAVSRLLGEHYYNRLKDHYQVSHFCTEIAQAMLTGRLHQYAEQESDLALIRMVANRLWHEDGTTGFAVEKTESTQAIFKPRFTGV